MTDPFSLTEDQVAIQDMARKLIASCYPDDGEMDFRIRFGYHS